MINSTNNISSTDSQRKISLIIGIGDYARGQSLKNTKNDAKQMSSLLKTLGFEIHGGKAQLDLKCQEMEHILLDFQYSIKKGDMVLFYFSGHGLQWENQNYLIPSDNFNEDQGDLCGSDLAKYAIHAQSFLNKIENREPFVTLFFLDCCRTYHLRNENLTKSTRGTLLERSHGLKAMDSQKAGTLIAFACAPGTTADDGNNEEENGLYTKHLLRHLRTPNEDIEILLRRVGNDVTTESNGQQIPYVTSALRLDHICLFQGKRETDLKKWKQNAQTVAGGNGDGKQLNQLSNPHGIFLDKKQNIFVVDFSNHRIMKWNKNDQQGQILAGGNEQGKRIDQLNHPKDMIVDKQNHSLIIADMGNRRIIQWKNQNQQEILIDNVGYCENHRVMKWRKDAQEGIIVAGGNGQGNRLNQLNSPQGIFVDDLNQIYIADCGNDRIMRWREGDKNGEIIVGINYGQTECLNQLHSPTDISFDVQGNLYVADYGNHRIQRFDLNCE
ncbi:unnamed protein product [Adineta ricciae]|uniref:Caspase family p20 domain-containing protein n=1 Tax=Adineta ricciae TaxID=249248 RepID=A0A815NTC1_ADIRI|nr:unnamed protein product [Adineta ricciae]